MFGIGDDDIEDERPVVIEHLLDGGAQFAFEMNAAPLDAETFGDFYEVGIEAGEIFRAADVGFVAENGIAADAAVEAVLPLHDHTEMLIIENHRFGGDFLDVGGGEFLDVHDERPIAVDIDDLFIGASDFGPECGGVTEAHGAETERADVAAGFVEPIELSRPHLVLAHAGCDDGLSLGEFVEDADRLLRDDMFEFLVAEWMIFFPRGDLGVPRLVVGCGKFLLREQLVEPSQSELDIAGDRELDAFIFIMFGSVDIDMNDLGLGGEFVGVTSDAIVETGAEAEEQIALINGPVAIG